MESKQLSVFHQNEKPAVANPIAAWASQTGKGLLFFTKRSEDKATPAGIINLVCRRQRDRMRLRLTCETGRCL